MDYRNKIIYQIYPRSFCDSNGDGIGDIQGIISKLDHVKSLNVDLIWLSPVYCSPNSDFGYDVSDYYDINPEYGTMADFDQLIKECDKRDMGIIMDIVANHTSDQHPWFKEAIADVNSPYRDYYFFKTSETDKEPNNWISNFGGSAWQKDPLVENGYYLTSFSPNQCDLNWENSNIKKEVIKILKFWLSKGVKGFRFDVINTISKTEGLPSHNPNKKGYQFAGIPHYVSLPKSHEYIKEVFKEVRKEYDFFSVGEGMLMNKQDAALYCGEDRGELDMMFNFDLELMNCGDLGKYDFRKLYFWKVSDMKHIINSWQKDSIDNHYWIANFTNNHDFPRMMSRYGNDSEYRYECAKSLLLLNLTLRGTPFIYQGEEIGMTNLKLKREQWQDFEAKNVYIELKNMFHVPEKLREKIVSYMTRDNARTPMQWDETENGGFTTGTPWLPVNPNTKMFNVKEETINPNSILNSYKFITNYRKSSDVLNYGDFKPILEKHKQIIAYSRYYKGSKVTVLINYSDSVARHNYQYPNKPVYNNYADLTDGILKPYQAIMFEI